MFRVDIPKRQNGQAMTEFIVTAAYLLVPLFIIVPLLAKYIDIKHAGINAARYQAWEYTAWHDPGDDHKIMDNFTAAAEPIKPRTATEAETSRRIFSRIQETTTSTDAVAITSGDSAITWSRGEANSLWTDHRGNYLLGTPAANSISTANDTPGFTLAGINIGSVINTMITAFDYIFQGFAFLVNLVGGTEKFSGMNTEGYTQVNLNLPVTTRINPSDPTRASTDSSGTPLVLNFASSAGVLSEGWNAGGFDHVYKQVGGAIPTTILKQLLNSPPLSWAWSVIEFMAPEMTSCLTGGRFSLAQTLGLIPNDGSLWLGYVDSDTVHPDRLSGGGVHVCDAAGRCRLQPNIPMSHVRCTP
jgi:hypothetical protein